MNKPIAKTIARIILGAFLVFAGVAHLTFDRSIFQALVPQWVPLNADFVVVFSGIIEILLGLALIAVPKKQQPVLGIIVAVFLIVVFTGNIAQYVDQRNAFGLDTDTKRLIRLFFQPPLIYWAWKSTQKEPD